MGKSTARRDPFLSDLAKGRDAAFEELDRRYRQRLCDLVEKQLDRCLRRREDPEDVVLSAMRTFCRRARQGEFRFAHEGALWRLLAQVTRRKLLKHAAYHRAKKRDPKREVYPDAGTSARRDLEAVKDQLVEGVVDTVISQSKSPDSELFQLQLYGLPMTEIKDLVLADLDSPYPEIFALWLHGKKVKEIAEELGNTTFAAARYKLDRIKGRLRRLLDKVKRER